MKEQGFVSSKVNKCGLHESSRAYQARWSVSDDPVALLSLGVEPLIQQTEILATVVYLDVVHARELPPDPRDQVLGPSITNPCQILREMHRCIPVVTHAQQEHLSVQLVDAAYRAIQPVRDVDWMRGGNLCGFWTYRRERVWAVTPEHVRKAPERVGYDAHPETWGCMGIERVIVVITHAGHDEGTGRAKCRPQCTDKPERPAFKRGDLGKGGVHDQDTARINTHGAELCNDVVSFECRYHLDWWFRLIGACRSDLSAPGR
jgi:hypothetical protein